MFLIKEVNNETYFVCTDNFGPPILRHNFYIRE